MDITRLKSICKSIDSINFDDLMQDTFIRLNGRYEVNEDYYKIFYTTAKNIFLDEKKKKKIKQTSIEEVKEIQDYEKYNPSLYKKALDSFLIKNKNTIFADVIELYLLCPNITRIANKIELNRLQTHRLIEVAKNGIGLEYIRIASNIGNDNDNTI